METSEYLDVFLDESREHLQSVNDHLLNLEKNPQDLAIVQEIFRSAHTLKGMAATMGFEDIADLTHKMENALDEIRNDHLTVTTDVLDVLLEAVESLEEMVASIAGGGDGKNDIEHLVVKLNELVNGDDKKDSTASDSTGKIVLNDYERTIIEESYTQGFSAYVVTVVLSADCILKAARTYMVFEGLEKWGEVICSEPPVQELEEERFENEFTVVFVTKARAEQVENTILNVSEVEDVRISKLELEEVHKTKKHADKQAGEKDVTNDNRQNESKASLRNTSKTIRVNLDRLDRLMNLFEEFVIDRGRLEDIASKFGNDELSDTVERITRISSELQSTILSLRMVPIEHVFNRFPRMVRNLSKELNKKVDFEIIGAETELDRTVIDEIGDPLVHLIRNSLDHGIELPEERRKKEKPETGKVVLKAYHSGNHVKIDIEDDGGGIDKEKVLKKAIENNIVSTKEIDRLTDEEIYQFIFSSGFSTSEQVSDVSGRGVGLDVVKNKIESLGGHVSVESIPNKGSRFMIQLPLTLSIIPVLLVKVGRETYAIPLSSIIETLIIKRDDLLTAHSQPVIDYRGSVIPVVFLKDVFQTTDGADDQEDYAVIIARKGDKKAGLIVDSFISQREIVLKSLGDYLQSVFAISGATILGDGQVVLIVDCNALIK